MAVYNIDIYQNGDTMVDISNMKLKDGMKPYPFRGDQGSAIYALELLNMSNYNTGYTTSYSYFPANNYSMNELRQNTLGNYDTGIKFSFIGSSLEIYGIIGDTGIYKVTIDNDIYYMNMKNIYGARQAGDWYKLFQINNLPYTKHEVSFMFIDKNDPKCTMVGNTSSILYFLSGMSVDGELCKNKNSNYYSSVLDKAILPYREYFLDTSDGKVGVERFGYIGYESKPVIDIGDGFKKVSISVTPQYTNIPVKFDKCAGLGYIPSLGITLYRGGAHASVSLFGRDFAKSASIMEYYYDWRQLMGSGGNIIGLNGAKVWDPASDYFDLVQSFRGVRLPRYENDSISPASLGYQNYYTSGIDKYWCQIDTDGGLGSIMTYEVGDIITETNSIEVWVEPIYRHNDYTIGIYVNGEYKGKTDFIPYDNVLSGSNLPTMKVAVISNVKKGDIVGLSCQAYVGGPYNYQYHNGTNCVNLAFLKINNIQFLCNISDYESYKGAKIKGHTYLKPKKLIPVPDPDKSIYNSYRSKFITTPNSPKIGTNISYIAPSTGPIFSVLNHDNLRFVAADSSELLSTKFHMFMGGLKVSTSGTYTDDRVYWVSSYNVPTGTILNYTACMRAGFNFTGKSIRVFSSYLFGQGVEVYIDGYYIGKLGGTTGGNTLATTKNCVFEITNLQDGVHSIFLINTQVSSNTPGYNVLDGFEVDTASVLSPFNIDECTNPYFNQYTPFKDQNIVTSRELLEVIDDITYKQGTNKTFDIDMEYISSDASVNTQMLKKRKERYNLNKKIITFPQTSPAEGVTNTAVTTSPIISNTSGGIIKKFMFNFTGSYICIRGLARTGSCLFIVLDGDVLPMIRCAKLVGSSDEKLVELSSLDDKEHSIMILIQGDSILAKVSNWIAFSSVDILSTKTIKTFNPHINKTLNVIPKYTYQGNPAIAKTNPLPNEKRIDITTDDNIIITSMYYQPHLIKYGDIKFSVTGTDSIGFISTYAWLNVYFVDMQIIINGEEYYAESYQNDSGQVSVFAQTPLVEALRVTGLNPNEIYSVVVRGMPHIPINQEGLKYTLLTHIDLNNNATLLEYIDKNTPNIIIPSIDDVSSVFSMDKYQLLNTYNKNINKNPKVIEYSYDADISTKLLGKSVEPKDIIISSKVKMNIRDILRRGQIYNQTGDNDNILIQFSRNRISWFIMSSDSEVVTDENGLYNKITEYQAIPNEELYFRIKVTPSNSLYIDEMIRSKLMYNKMYSDRLDAIATVLMRNARIYGHGIQSEITAYKYNANISRPLIHDIKGNTEIMVQNSGNAGVLVTGNTEAKVMKRYNKQLIEQSYEITAATVLPNTSKDIFADNMIDVNATGTFKSINVPVNSFIEIKLPIFVSIAKPEFLYVENNYIKGIPDNTGVYTVDIILVSGVKSTLEINVQDINRIY